MSIGLRRPEHGPSTTPRSSSVRRTNSNRTHHFLTEFGGQTRPEGVYLAGPPELVVEVAYSSVAYDLHSKRRVYERLGVREYVVVVIMENRIEWFVSKEGRFVDLEADEHRVSRIVVRCRRAFER